MDREVNVKCEPAPPFEVTVKSEPLSPRCDLADNEPIDPNYKEIDRETDHAKSVPEFTELNKPCEPKTSEHKEPNREPVSSESGDAIDEQPSLRTSEITTDDTNPEFICVKPEPLDNFSMELEEIQNDGSYLIEIKREQTDDDDDGDDDENVCDTDSNLSADDADLPPFNESDFKRSDSGQYQCPLCEKWLSKKGNLQRHLTIHSKAKLTCKYCAEVQLTMDMLKTHIAEEHKKIFECEECHKSFRTSSNLNQHMRSHVKPYQCDLCEKNFSTMGNLNKHRGKGRCKKPNSKPLHCEICDKNFKTPFLYKSHQIMHSTERPFHCKVCKMTFKQSGALSRHMQLHNDDKPFSCDYCGKKFTSKGLLKPHLRSHTGERPYTCAICQKSFTHKHNMQKHSLLHNVIKHLVCEICHKAFPRESRLKYHMRKHMVDNRPFKCEHCPKSYSCKQNIVRHYKKKHPTKTYDKQETDASIATVMWETVIKKQLEEQKDYILPDEDVPIKCEDI